MKIGTTDYVITRQIQNSDIPFKYQVNLPWNTLVGLPKAFQRKTNWKHWIEYIKPIWCRQQIRYYMQSLIDLDNILNEITMFFTNCDSMNML